VEYFCAGKMIIGFVAFPNLLGVSSANTVELYGALEGLRLAEEQGI